MENTTLATTIEHKLKELFLPEFIQVKDTSDLHKKHAEAQRGGSGHLHVTLVSQAFETVPPIERHRMVYSALKEAMGSQIHAMALHTFSPSEWQQKHGATAQTAATQPTVPVAENSLIGSADLPTDKNHSGPKGNLPTLDEMEAAYIQKVLNLTEGHLGQTCSILGITRPRLTRKIEKYDLSVPNRYITTLDLSNSWALAEEADA